MVRELLFGLAYTQENASITPMMAASRSPAPIYTMLLPLRLSDPSIEDDRNL